MSSLFSLGQREVIKEVRLLKCIDCFVHLYLCTVCASPAFKASAEATGFHQAEDTAAWQLAAA